MKQYEKNNRRLVKLINQTEIERCVTLITISINNVLISKRVSITSDYFITMEAVFARREVRVAKSPRSRAIERSAENARRLKAFSPRGPGLSNYYQP